MDTLINRIYPYFTFDKINNPWFINLKTGICGKLSKDFDDITNISFLGIDEWGYSKAVDVHCVDDRLIFVSRWNDARPFIRIVGINGEPEKRILLKSLFIRKKCKSEPFFSSSIIDGDYIYYIGCSYPAIVRLNVRSLEIDYITDWVDEVDQDIKDDNILGYSTAGVLEQDEKRIYIPCSLTPGIIILDKENLKTEFRSLSISSYGLGYMCRYNETSFLLSECGPWCNSIYLWDIKTNEVIREWKVAKNPNYLSVSYILKSKNNDFYIFPWQNKGCTDLDIYCLKNNIIVKTGILENEYKSSGSLGIEIVYAAWEDDETLLFVTGNDLLWHRYNVITGKKYIFEVAACNDNNDYKNALYQYYNELANLRMPVNEEELDLKNFVNQILT